MVLYNDMKEKGAVVPINNLFFDLNKADLKPTSIAELERVAKILKESKMKVEIGGHTDNTGNKEFNQSLSERRANAVMRYLIELECDADKLVTKGYGDSKPSVPNNSEANRAKNRRVEIKVIQ